MLVVSGRGQHQDGGGQVLLAHRGEHAEAVKQGHEQVEQDDVRAQRADRVKRGGAVGGFARDLDSRLGGQQEPQSLPDHLVVVGDEHPDHRVAS